MPVFQVALTGDFLDEQGQSAYGDIRLDLLTGQPDVAWKFLHDQAPRPGESAYHARVHSMQINPDHIRGVHGLVVLRPAVSRSAFATPAQDLVCIGRSGASYDKIDLDACTENGVAVFNAPFALSHSTASAALALMLALSKRLFPQDKATRAGAWHTHAALMGNEIERRTLGIVGLGHSGRELARLVAPFRMRVLAFSPHADPAQAALLGVELTSLERLLREADFASLHCRLTPETTRLIGSRELALMKSSAYLINLAHGGLVDQESLVHALRARRIAGAGLDVFAVEPLPKDDPLVSLENVILTPHWLASTSNAWTAAGEAMSRGMLRAARGQLPDSIVNPAVLNNSEFQRKLNRFATAPGGPV